MAELVAILATTHHPFYYATSKLPPEDAPPFAAEWVRKVEAYRQTLTRARPDVLVMVGSDHFHQLWLDNMPQFLVGKAPFYDANYYNEEREFGLPKLLLTGHEELSAHILRAGLDAGFDFAFSNELRVDHSITCPIFTVRPQNDLPIVPIYTNIFAPPLPRPERFVKLGQGEQQPPGGRAGQPGRLGDLGQAHPRVPVVEAGQHVQAARQGLDEVRPGAASRHAHLPATSCPFRYGRTASFR